MALRKTSVVDRGLHSTANRSGESFGLIEASTNASIWLFAPMEACLITRGANSGSPGRNRSQACLGTWADSYGSQRILDNHTTEVPANSGRRVRGLPTEAEWEYACRAGTRTKYSFGEDEGKLSEYAWFDTNAKIVGESYAHEVGQKKANGNGLHDMHGNVSEWCSDLYDPKYYANSEKVDPFASTSSRKGRVTRGGNWYAPQAYCRSAARDGVNLPHALSSALGFRLVLLD
jgi:hypothetical protein